VNRRRSDTQIVATCSENSNDNKQTTDCAGDFTERQTLIALQSGQYQALTQHGGLGR